MLKITTSDDVELFSFEDSNKLDKAKQMVFQIRMLFLERNPERLTTIPCINSIEFLIILNPS
jgi:hypothetical protein